MWIFSTREFVAMIYSFIIVLAVLLSKKIRPSVINVIKSAWNKKLVIPFLIMLLYTASIVFVLTLLPLWNWVYLKDIIIWTLLSGVPICFNAIKKAATGHYFRNMILDNLKFIAIVEFFTGTFTFSLLVEFILQPVLFFFYSYSNYF